MTQAPDPPPLDIPRLLETLNSHGVEFLLVGGVAAIAHGAHRPTNDVDCVARRTPPNLDRVAAALRELNARLHVEGLSDEESADLPVQVVGPTLARMEISTWRTDAGDLDILADLPDSGGRHQPYEELMQRAETLDVGGLIISVAALDDVIASKRWASRPKDHAALPELLRLRDDPGREPT